jgi:glutamate racemase
MLNAQTQISKEITFCSGIPSYAVAIISSLQEKLYALANPTTIEIEYFLKHTGGIGAYNRLEYNAGYNTIELVEFDWRNGEFIKTLAFFNLLSVPTVKVLPTINEVKNMSINAQIQLIGTMFYEMAEIDHNSTVHTPTRTLVEVMFLENFGFDSSNAQVKSAAYNLFSDILPF